MEERELRSRVSWIVGLVLATAFVGTIIWSVAQDADDDDDDDATEVVDLDDIEGPVILDPNMDPPGAPLTTELVVPEATLAVHSDRCGVTRSELPVEPESLTWVFKDADGFEVLSRNALGETQYRYFQPGTYTVVLEAWSGDRYVEVSNTVEVTC